MGKQKKKKSGEIKLFLTKDAKTKKKGYGDSRKRERERNRTSDWTRGGEAFKLGEKSANIRVTDFHNDATHSTKNLFSIAHLGDTTLARAFHE